MFERPEMILGVLPIPFKEREMSEHLTLLHPRQLRQFREVNWFFTLRKQCSRIFLLHACGTGDVRFVVCWAFFCGAAGVSADVNHSPSLWQVTQSLGCLCLSTIHSQKEEPLSVPK